VQKQVEPSAPLLVAIHPRLALHSRILGLVHLLARLQRLAFSPEGGEVSEFSRQCWAEGGPLNRFRPPGPPPQLSDVAFQLLQELHGIVEDWDRDAVIDGVRYEGTSLAHDFRQAATPGGIKIDGCRYGSHSLHGAVIAFAHWVREAIIEEHKARGGELTMREWIAPEAVRAAWRRCADELSVDGQDPDKRGLIADLEAEYTRLLPLPRVNSELLRAARQGQTAAPPAPVVVEPWVPRNLQAAMLAGLEAAGDRGLPTWAALAEKIDRDAGEVRREGPDLVKAGHVELAGKHPTLRPTITAKGREFLTALRVAR
jgi:hypothetical protein